MSMVNEQWHFLKDIALLIKYAESRGFVLTGGELWRTPEQQKIYVETGRSKTMNSNHLKRLAMDFNIFVDGELCWDMSKLKELGTYWESLSPENRWGGFFSTLTDMPHFERNLPNG